MSKKLHLSQVLWITLCFALTGCTSQPKEPPTKKIEGTIEIAPKLQKKLKPQAVLYLIARKQGVTSGPPIAVKRLEQPLAFPISFEMNAQDVMIPDTPFEGKLAITARVSQRGSASPVLAGDIEGNAEPQPIEVGAKNVKVLLNRVR